MASDQVVPGATGGSVHVLEVARGLAARGHQVHAVVRRQSGSDAPDVREGVQLHGVDWFPPHRMFRFRARPAGDDSANDRLELSFREKTAPGRSLPPSEPTAWSTSLGELAGAAWTESNFPSCDTDFAVQLPAPILRGMRSPDRRSSTPSVTVTSRSPRSMWRTSET